MNLHRLFILLLFMSLFLLPGCDLIAGIFKAGFWSAVILLLLIVFLIGFAVYKLGNRT